jgi:lipid II:glycine glycyltransferase (peptidoglycan interpeptide bridge formation enzyme)
MSMSAAPLTLRNISPAEHRGFIESGASGDQTSFLQCPAWGEVKEGWRSRSLGWFAGPALTAVATVLYRPIPRTRWSLAYLPEGPLIDWLGERDPRPVADWLDPLVRRLKSEHVFSVRIGPKVPLRTWSTETVKRGMADPATARLGDLAADRHDDRAAGLGRQLRSLGWRQDEPGGSGFGDVQPRYFFQLPLRGRAESEVFAGLNQQWRRNIRLAERAGVEVVQGTADQLPDFHRLYLETAERDRFTPRPLGYFQRMFQVLGAEDPERIRLYLARYQGEYLAGATMVTVGDRAWYGYGASSSRLRELKPSNALQWRMIQDCLRAGKQVYDLRGVGDTLDPEHRLYGLLRFKVGTGGEAVEYLGEWNLSINRLLARAIRLHLARR